MADPLMDEEATVESVPDQYFTDEEQPRIETPEQTGGLFYGKAAAAAASFPWSVSEINLFLVLLSLNPWYYVLLLGVLYYLYYRRRDEIHERYGQWQQERAESAEIAAIKKNPDLYREKMEAMERARRAMQERYDREAAVAAERATEKEEERRKDKLEQLENLAAGKGYKNKVKVEEAEFKDGVKRSGSDKKKATFRSGTSGNQK